MRIACRNLLVKQRVHGTDTDRELTVAMDGIGKATSVMSLVDEVELAHWMTAEVSG